jgi:quinol monooxygenase YgiN
MSELRYLAIWQFQVKNDCVADFERIYGPNGLWAQLFRQSSEYLGTELVRDLDRSGKYLTIDRWTSREALQKFKRQFAVEYAALDKTCDQLTASEDLVGDFESIKNE